MSRFTTNWEEMQEAIDSVDEYEDCEVVQNTIQIYQHVLETLKKFSSMAIQDDYFNWNENDKHNEVSKLLLID